MPRLTDDTARIDRVADAALDAFWQTVANEYPEITTGDLEPPEAFAFDQSIQRVIRAWLLANEPEQQG